VASPAPKIAFSCWVFISKSYSTGLAVGWDRATGD